MDVICPECGLYFSYITENKESRYVVEKAVKCPCGNVYPIKYPGLSRHQFNAAVLIGDLDPKNYRVLGETNAVS